MKKFSTCKIRKDVCTLFRNYIVLRKCRINSLCPLYRSANFLFSSSFDTSICLRRTRIDCISETTVRRGSFHRTFENVLSFILARIAVKMGRVINVYENFHHRERRIFITWDFSFFFFFLSNCLMTK